PSGGITSEYGHWRHAPTLPRRSRDMAASLRPFFRAGDTLPHGPIGAFGFYLRKVDLWDPRGLVTPFVQPHLAWTPGGSPGHEAGVDIGWFCAHRPTVLGFRFFPSDADPGRLRQWWQRQQDPDRRYAPVLHHDGDRRLV